MKVLCYNIHHGVGMDDRLDLERIGKVVAESGADIIGLQELDRHWSERSRFLDQSKALAEMLDMNYVFAANLDLDPEGERAERRQYGLAVLSKYPIIDSGHSYLTSSSDEQRGLLQATIQVPGKPVHFINTHLGLSPEERAVQAAEVVALIRQQGSPSILVGDMNARPDTKEIRILSEAFQDAFVEQSAAYTFPADRPHVRCDYIFYTDGLELVSADTIETLASDHLPVTAVFKRKGKQGLSQK